MSVLGLARAEVRALAPYSSARMEASGGAVLLNANESAWPPFGGGDGLNRYPDPQPRALLERLAALYGVDPGQVLVGRGSDEGIDLLVRAFCRAGRDAVLVMPPTFGMYAVAARIQGAGVVEVPLNASFALDVDALLAALTPEVRLVFACAPNNPTGGGVPRADLLRLAAALAGRALLVVDEAYIEFADAEHDFASVADALPRFDNLMVLRTLSKAWALAGARVGALLAHAEVIALLRKLMPPYPLPTPSVDAALRALAPTGEARMRDRIATIVSERARMATALRGMPCVREVLPAQANFLCVRFHAVAAAWAALQGAGIVVRNVTRYRGLADALRITIGMPDENERVLEVLVRLRAAVECSA